MLVAIAHPVCRLRWVPARMLLPCTVAVGSAEGPGVEGVHDERDADDTFAGLDVGEVRDPVLVRGVGDDVAVDEARDRVGPTAGQRGDHAPPVDGAWCPARAPQVLEGAAGHRVALPVRPRPARPRAAGTVVGLERLRGCDCSSVSRMVVMSLILNPWRSLSARGKPCHAQQRVDDLEPRVSWRIDVRTTSLGGKTCETSGACKHHRGHDDCPVTPCPPARHRANEVAQGHEEQRAGHGENE